MVADIPTTCTSCNHEKLLLLGFGTQRIEEDLSKLFPTTKLVRIDHDTTRKKNSLTIMLEKIHSKEYQILIGTQMLAKGHHFPDVTMVVILNVDQSLFNSDFRAAERLAQ